MTDRMAKIRDSVKRELTAVIENILATDEEIWKTAVDPIVQTELNDCQPPYFYVDNDGKLKVVVSWGDADGASTCLDIVAEIKVVGECEDDAQMVCAVDDIIQKLTKLRHEAKQRIKEERVEN